MSDFRTQAGVYRAYVKDLLSEATLLQAVPPSAASTTMAGGTAAQGTDNATQPLGYVGLSGGCPAGWKTLGGSCFTRVTVGEWHGRSVLALSKACRTPDGRLLFHDLSGFNACVPQQGLDLPLQDRHTTTIRGRVPARLTVPH